MYKNITKLENIIQKIKPVINLHFVNGPFLEIKNSPGDNYKIYFTNKKTGELIHYSEIGNNCWTACSYKYFIDWSIKLIKNDSEEIIIEPDYKDKRVFITFESSSLGDTFAWIPYVDEFRKKHNCHVVCSTFMNDLFIENYPEIEFIEPGNVVHNLYAMYKIGWFYNEDGSINQYLSPNDFKKQPLQRTATDILGLEYKEIIPKLSVPNVEKKKKVGIAIHGTAQAKYWNNPTGWQEVVDYLNEQNYEVMLYSRENDGYMGNQHPNGITKFKGGSIQEVIDDLATCEFFIGIGSGLSWLAWSVGLPIVLISGFSDEYTETQSNTYRVINKNVCTGCFNSHRLDAGDWNWCPINKNTDRQFECSKSITGQMVIETIKRVESNH